MPRKLAVLLGSVALTAMLLGCGDSHSSPAPAVQSGIPRPDQRVQMQSNLKQIGLAYKTAAIGATVRGPDDLGKELAPLLKSVRGEVTVLHVTHSRAEAELLGDLVLRFEGGRVAAEDRGASPGDQP